MVFLVVAKIFLKVSSREMNAVQGSEPVQGRVAFRVETPIAQLPGFSSKV